MGGERRGISRRCLERRLGGRLSKVHGITGPKLRKKGDIALFTSPPRKGFPPSNAVTGYGSPPPSLSEIKSGGAGPPPSFEGTKLFTGQGGTERGCFEQGGGISLSPRTALKNWAWCIVTPLFPPQAHTADYTIKITT